MLESPQRSEEQRRTVVKAARSKRGASRLLPARLGEYELFDHIGRGGMADIYRARKEGAFGVVREVVIKEILPELAQSERLAELLASEARMASKLEHTNVVRIEDLQREEETLFIAMEYVEGLDLRELMRLCARDKKWIPLEIALRIGSELLQALDYAHKFTFTADDGSPSTGIVHRDVSPSNILLSFEGEVKLCDFGIALGFEGDKVTGAMVEGKAGYMSPEQARGEGLDARADIFAAGIVLWELVTARRLYKAKEGETLFDVARRAPVRSLPKKGLPEEDTLRKILARALCAEPAGRYASAREMRDDLDAYAARAGLKASTLALRRWLVADFSQDILQAQKRRELATRALAGGAVASVEILARPRPPAPSQARADEHDSSQLTTTGPSSRPRRVLGILGLLALALAALAIWLLLRR